MQTNKLALVLVLMWLLSSGNTLNWQGHGNFTADNLTQINSFMNSSLDSSWNYNTISNGGSVFDGPALGVISQRLSSQLNSAWDRYWNVLFIYINTQENLDSVLYGYAFRGHWLWFNGFKFVDNYYTSFVIWKDYNCFNEYQITASSRTTFTGDDLTTISTMITNQKSSVSKSQIWLAAQIYVNALEDSAHFSGSAFSVVMSQSDNVAYYGKVCAKGAYYTLLSIGNNWGSAAIFQMR